MKKIAFFVEGATEQLLVQKLFESICKQGSLAVSSTRGKGGGDKLAISWTVINAMSVTTQTEYYVLIADCSGESNIKTYIKDRRQFLIKQGYSKIVGIRDVYPKFQRTEIAKLQQYLYYAVPQSQIPTIFILSVMEVEAWILSEHTHFSRLNALLTIELIRNQLSFDPEKDDMELRDEPSTDLHNVYSLVGERYAKEMAIIQRTIGLVDCAHMYLSPKTNSFKQLVSEIDSFLG